MKKYIRGVRIPVALLAASLMIGTAFAEESAVPSVMQTEQEQAGQELEEELEKEAVEKEEPEEEKDSEQNKVSEDEDKEQEPDAETAHPEQKPADDEVAGQDHNSEGENQKEDSAKEDPSKDDSVKEEPVKNEGQPETGQDEESIGGVPEETIKDTEGIPETGESTETPTEKDKDTEDTESKDKEVPGTDTPANKVTEDKNEELPDNTENTVPEKQEKIFTDGNTEVREPEFHMESGVVAEQFKDLKLSETQIKELIRMTGGEMSEERLQVVLHAYSLVGKVHYFWGGKSEVIGWDDRWGIPAVVTSEGSETTGTACTYGLDCSGFITWAFLNAAGDSGIVGDIGHGTSAQWAHSTEIEEEEALPGDLAFMAPGDSSDNHVGIVVGRSKSGQLMFVHCSGGYDNVVVTTANEGSFNYLRRPDVYTDKSIGFSEMVENNPKAMTESNKELFEKYLDLNLLKNEG